MRLIFSLIFWPYMALSSAIFFVGALALRLITLPFDRDERLLHLYSCFWAASYLYANPTWHIHVEGRERVDRAEPYVIVSNHQSLADILSLFATYLPFKWVSKRSVFKVPFIGWNMWLNRYVALERGDKKSVEKMAVECAAWLRRGVSVLIFPEGTRSPDGEVRPFRAGAFRIARQARVRVLPLVVDGTADALPKHELAPRHSANCRVKILPPIDVSGFPTAEAAGEAVRQVIISELSLLRAEKRAA